MGISTYITYNNVDAEWCPGVYFQFALLIQSETALALVCVTCRMATAADYGASQLKSALGLALSYLVNSVDATALLPVAWSRQLITERQRPECASELNPYTKVEKFLRHLQRAVNGDSSKFHTFVQVL